MVGEYKETLDFFKQRLPVDQFNLETECARQPSLLEEIGEWVAKVKADAKTKKEHVEFIKADLSLKIRRNPENYGLPEKNTEGSISAAITTNSEYQNAVAAHIEADKLANEASTLLTSAEQRKSSIRDLVRLFIHSYYNREDIVNHKDWEEAEQAIVELRNKKAREGEESIQEDEVEEE